MATYCIQNGSKRKRLFLRHIPNATPDILWPYSKCFHFYLFPCLMYSWTLYSFQVIREAFFRGKWFWEEKINSFLLYRSWTVRALSFLVMEPGRGAHSSHSSSQLIKIVIFDMVTCCLETITHLNSLRISNGSIPELKTYGWSLAITFLSGRQW